MEEAKRGYCLDNHHFLSSAGAKGDQKDQIPTHTLSNLHFLSLDPSIQTPFADPDPNMRAKMKRAEECVIGNLASKPHIIYPGPEARNAGEHEVDSTLNPKHSTLNPKP